MAELSANDLLPSEWGGDIEVVKTSAITGEGIDDLLETLLTVAELHEYKANPNRPALGTASKRNKKQAAVWWPKSSCRTERFASGDVVVCGEAYGKVKAMYDTLNPDSAHRGGRPGSRRST